MHWAGTDEQSSGDTSCKKLLYRRGAGIACCPGRLSHGEHWIRLGRCSRPGRIPELACGWFQPQEEIRGHPQASTRLFCNGGSKTRTECYDVTSYASGTSARFQWCRALYLRALGTGHIRQALPGVARYRSPFWMGLLPGRPDCTGLASTNCGTDWCGLQPFGPIHPFCRAGLEMDDRIDERRETLVFTEAARARAVL